LKPRPLVNNEHQNGYRCDDVRLLKFVRGIFVRIPLALAEAHHDMMQVGAICAPSIHHHWLYQSLNADIRAKSPLYFLSPMYPNSAELWLIKVVPNCE